MEERRTETWRTNKNMTDEHHLHNGVMERVNEACADHWLHTAIFSPNNIAFHFRRGSLGRQHY